MLVLALVLDIGEHQKAIVILARGLDKVLADST